MGGDKGLLCRWCKWRHVRCFSKSVSLASDLLSWAVWSGHKAQGTRHKAQGINKRTSLDCHL